MLAQAFFLVSLVSTVLAVTFKLPVIESGGRHAVGFAANPSINAKGIFQAIGRGKKVLATFPSGPGTGNNVKIVKQNIPGVSDVISFVADMDVDCDGVFVSSTYNS
jgi:hypothetical protein